MLRLCSEQLNAGLKKPKRRAVTLWFGALLRYSATGGLMTCSACS
jgi:hypothetical protein